ncbi:MAG TPA: CDP-alcohol phosphatidyltransferase family protein, partial [Xanthobacteraceae bacterium]|nr:CDP-alcohol phosphatidyltransferase family protein [Xanthobacteraceae bacterium]
MASAPKLGKAVKRGYVRAPESGPDALNLPNLITIARILLVPVIVWAIGSGEMLFAFILFLVAGLSDA